MQKQKYKKMFCVVKEELNKIDPLGVVLENPNLCDEYDYENQKILTMIKDSENYTDLAQKMCDIFKETTNMNFTPEYFYESAKNILNRIKNL